jgi:hypothetical protein
MFLQKHAVVMPSGEPMQDLPDDNSNPQPGESDKVSLNKVARMILEECRMILPGLQALFGFQLIAVFNKPFFEILNASQQKLHLLALGLVAAAVGLLMAPAAYHRQIEPERVTRDFVRLATLCLTLGMAPLMFAITIDFYLIAMCILHDFALAITLSSTLLLFLAGLWFVLPHIRRRQ